jgi:hypothetical protein
MTDQARSSDHHPHGTLAEEAAKLAEMAQQWLEGRSTADLSDVWAEATSDGEPPESRTCPICRAKRLLAGLSPEVFEHLSDAAVSLSAAVRAMGKVGDRAGRE